MKKFRDILVGFRLKSATFVVLLCAGAIHTNSFGQKFFDNDFLLVPPSGDRLTAAANLLKNPALDAAFGSGGRLVGNFSGASFGNDQASDAVVQPDGKIIVAGFITENGVQRFALVRYLPDGTLDPSFGSGGLTATLPPEVGIAAGFRGVALQANGSIVAGGFYRHPSTGAFRRAVARYGANGALDVSFGTNGFFTLDLGFIGNDQGDVAIQPDGKIIVAGTDKTSSSQPDTFGIIRLNANGTLDATFGTGGRIRTLVGTSDGGWDLELLPDGKIVVAGFTNGVSAFAIVRYNANGSLDTTFDGDGKVITAFSVPATGFRIAVQPDGKYVVVGGTRVSPTDIAVARYDANGSLDPAFDGDGLLLLDVDGSGDTGNNVIVRNGKILITGSSTFGINTVFSAVQLLSNGAPDASFGTNGRVLVDFNDGVDSSFHSIMQPDGKILQFGFTTDLRNGSRDFALIRLNAETNATEYDFDGDGKSDPAVFRQGNWFQLRSAQGFAAQNWGIASDALVPGDYDGDGVTDPAVARTDGQTKIFYVLRSATGTFSAVAWGTAEDVPVNGDFDGDNRDDIAVFDSSEGIWRISSPDGARKNEFRFGRSGDLPVSGDYDGDGVTDAAVYRAGLWLIRGSQDGFRAVPFGLPDDKPQAADYDGDGRTDIAVYRAGVWYILRSGDAQFQAVAFGLASDTPVPADYDGDGRADPAVFRSGVWYMFCSSIGLQAVEFGQAGDLPIPMRR